MTDARTLLAQALDELELLAPSTRRLRLIEAIRAHLAAEQPEPREADETMVICPNCVHQFRAIPEQVQRMLLLSGHNPPFTAPPSPAAVPPGYVLVPVEPTPEMVKAYLIANTQYWHEVDQQPFKPGIWRNGTPEQATAEGYRAMIAARPGETK